MSVVHRRSQVISVSQCELIGVDGGGRVAQVGKLFREALFGFPILFLDGILNRTGHRVVHAQHGALHQFDFTGCVASKTAARGLALLPGLRRCLGHGRLNSRATIKRAPRGFLVGAIREDGHTRILKSIAPQGIRRGIRIVERSIEGTRLVSVEERLLAFGLFGLFFEAVSVLIEKVELAPW